MSRSAVSRPVLFLASLVMLAACGQNPSAPVMVGPNLPRFEGQKPATDGLTKQASVSSVSTPQTATGPSSVTEPGRLKGLTPLQVREVLGQPGFQLRDAPAEIWQYRGHGCTLDLYIYDLGNGQSVEHWAVRSPARVNDSECFQQLVDQGHSHQGS